MSNINLDPSLADDAVLSQPDDSSFAQILSDFEQQHAEKPGETVAGRIVSVNDESIVIDVGRKIEGVLLLSTWRETESGEPKTGDAVSVSVGPMNEEGYYQLSTVKVERPKDWSGLQNAFDQKLNIAGVVTEQTKGGFRVNIGVTAFMPASRSGVRESDDMPKLVGQEIQCRITKLDSANEDVVVDRRVVLEEEQVARKQQRFAELKEGDVVTGQVRTVTDFGAFVDLGGVDGLLHVIDMAWTRVAKATDLVKPGDELTVKVLKIDPGTRKISLGTKQLQEDPWTLAARTFHQGDRVSGTVSRLTDFGAFIELMPGIDGLIHLSELSWDKRVRKPGDVFKPGDRIEAIILQVDPAAKRIGLGYKQLLGDPWEAAAERLKPGTVIEGPVTNVAQFGAWVDLGDGIEGMVHVSDITNEKRLEHAKDKLAKGSMVRTVVLEVDTSKRRIRLGMRQLEPTAVDHFIADNKVGDTVSGRIVDVQGDRAKVEVSDGVLGTCRVLKNEDAGSKSTASQPADVSSLTAMLAAKWKQGGGNSGSSGKESLRAGQVRAFRIANLDAAKRTIELELAG